MDSSITRKFSLEIFYNLSRSDFNNLKNINIIFHKQSNYSTKYKFVKFIYIRIIYKILILYVTYEFDITELDAIAVQFYFILNRIMQHNEFKIVKQKYRHNLYLHNIVYSYFLLLNIISFY